MIRISFIKRLFSGVTAAIITPQLLADNRDIVNNKFSFDELFIVHDGNDILIYPKKESVVYKNIEKTFSDRLDLSRHYTYLPVHHLSIPIKDSYTFEDFLPVKYYFECVYGRTTKYTVEGHGVSYRFVKDAPDRMHLEVFLA